MPPLPCKWCGKDDSPVWYGVLGCLEGHVFDAPTCRRCIANKLLVCLFCWLPVDEFAILLEGRGWYTTWNTTEDEWYSLIGQVQVWPTHPWPVRPR
jgi:hypothetical protein